MSSMGEAVHERVERIREHHERLKKHPKYGRAIRPLTLVSGWLLLVAGFITIPFPGPGWLMVFVSIGILSLELEWPHRLLHWAIAKYDAIDAWFKRQSTAVKGGIGFLLLVLTWFVFAFLFWAGWKLGMLDWARRWLQPFVDWLPDWLGLE